MAKFILSIHLLIKTSLLVIYLKIINFFALFFVTLMIIFIEDSVVVIMNIDLAYFTHCYFSVILNGPQHCLWQNEEKK